MHRMLLNRATIGLTLRPRSGFVVKTGDKGVALINPALPDSQALRATRWFVAADGTPEQRETVFIPGSSLKGTFRSAAERILRSLGEREDLACDPHDHSSRCQRGAVSRVSGWDDTAKVHAGLCLACRTFGSQQAAGRVLFADAFPADARAWKAANDTQRRAGVALDRRTGGPARSKLYETEVVWGGDFSTEIHLENFEVWQLALLGVVIEDVTMGLVRIGSARTRGLGGFEAIIDELTVRAVGAATQTAPSGVAGLRPGLAGEYGWLPEPSVIADGATVRSGRETVWTWAGDGPAREFLARCEEATWASLVTRAGGPADA